MPGTVEKHGVGRVAVMHRVAITTPDGAVARVEIVVHPFGFRDCDVGFAQCVDTAYESGKTSGGRNVDRDDLTTCVHAGVGSACNVDLHFVSGNGGHHFGENTFDAVDALVDCKATELCAVVPHTQTNPPKGGFV